MVITTLDRLCDAFGWQGGTIWQVIDGIKELRDQNRRLRAVIDELPEEFVYMGILNHKHFDKSSLLKKHGVEE